MEEWVLVPGFLFFFFLSLFDPVGRTQSKVDPIFLKKEISGVLKILNSIV